MRKIIKKADIVLFFILIALGLALSYPAIYESSSGEEVVIRVNGEVYGTYSLHSDKTILIDSGDHINKIIIKDGHVQMAESDCHNQLCVRQGSIHLSNQAIVCLPNRVVVEIIGGEGEYDVISG